MFLCLLMPDFRLQAALRWREASGPAALVEEKSGLLLEVNAGAAERGILPGLTGPQAMARDGRVLLLPPSPSQEECLAHLLTARAQSLSPNVENTAPGLVLADLSTAAKSLCWQKLAEGVVGQFRVDALEVRAGLASTPDLAVLAARGARPAAVVYDAPAFVAALPIGALEPSESLRQTFQDWGIRTVGDFLRLPRSGVVERLGPEAQEMLRRVSGRHKRPLRLLRTPPEYAEAFDFEYEVETAEPLLFLLRRFLDDLSSRLGEAGRVAREMILEIPLDDGSRHERTFCLPAPTAERDVLFRILHTHLEALQLARRPVGVRLQLKDAPPSGDQLRLFESALRDPNRFGETLARLKALVGNDGVGVPRAENTHEPDRFVLRDNFPARPPGRPVPSEGIRRGLPLRRRRPAESGQVVVQEGRPVSLCFPSLSGAVRQSSGPFRMSGHWWDAQSWDIEEWDVELSDGSLFRLACRGGRWTVEGCYDVC